MDLVPWLLKLFIIFIISNFRKCIAGLPDLSAGLDCDREPHEGEYCDRYGNGEIKQCRLCSVENMKNEENENSEIIDYPKECEYVEDCRQRCPEGLSEENIPPKEICFGPTTDLTTLGWETTDFITTSATEDFSTDNLLSTTEYDSTPRAEHVIPEPEPGSKLLVIIIACTVPVVAITCFVIAIWVKLKCKKRDQYTCTTATSPPTSSANLIDTERGDVCVPLRSPVYDSSPAEIHVDVKPSHNSVTVTASLQDSSVEGSDQSSDENGILMTSEEPTFHAKLRCPCSTEPVIVGPEGASFLNLQPRMKYEILVGILINGSFEERKRTDVCTEGDCKCSMTLYHMRQNRLGDLMALGMFFEQARQDGKILQAVKMVVDEKNHITSATLKRNKLLDVILDVDSQHRPDERSSLKLLEISEALYDGVEPGTNPPACVVEIIQALSSLHPDCMSCQHMVHLVSENDLGRVTTV